MMKWIRVDEGLPEISETYHVIWQYDDLGSRQYGTADFNTRSEEWTDPNDEDGYHEWFYQSHKHVTHWLHFEYPPMPDDDYDMSEEYHKAMEPGTHCM